METAPASVLVIEDQPMMRETLIAAIASDPNLMVAAPVVNAGAKVMIPLKPDVILLAFKPDIILMALGNPGLDDLAVLAALHKSLPGTPILALTSNEVPGQEQLALDAGAQVVLTKSAPRADLLRTLREIQAASVSGHSRSGF